MPFDQGSQEVEIVGTKTSVVARKSQSLQKQGGIKTNQQVKNPFRLSAGVF